MRRVTTGVDPASYRPPSNSSTDTNVHWAGVGPCTDDNSVRKGDLGVGITMPTLHILTSTSELYSGRRVQ